MAKRGRRLVRARKEARADDSLLVRSAESLGRVIGSLQRQVQRVSNYTSSTTSARSGTRKPAAARKASASRKRTAARKSSKKR